MRFLLIFSMLAFGEEEVSYDINPCIDIPEDGVCPSGEEGLEAVRDNNADCYVRAAELEGAALDKCCYDIIVTSCGNGCGGK